LKLSSLVIVLVSLADSFVTQAASLVVLLVEHALRAGQLVVEVKVLLGPIKRKNRGNCSRCSEFDMKPTVSLSIVRAI
jgi:hypothetical protein